MIVDMCYRDEIHERVREYISDNVELMKTEGLHSVLIRENGIFPSVIYILKQGYIVDHEYWRNTREETRQCGAEFVSSYYENDRMLYRNMDMKKLHFPTLE